ncbi:hypothetical protein [Leadbetterella sp. DM7]|uniref:hypothetical protein n=1 Tax=Leadbetterella sp. DM7 TaxID=3235085 RepID=UPI00349E8280
MTKTVMAQRYYGVSGEEFGKSKIQNKEFQWRTFSSANFTYNFYRGGEQISRNAAAFLEKSYPRITGILGYIPYEPVTVFVFNSSADLNSTNLIGETARVENGTLLDSRHSRILTAYEKNDSLFHKQLVSSVSSIYVYDMLYGGNVRESIESQILLNLPEWFTAGISAYVAEEDNSARFDAFKTAIAGVQSQRLKNLKGETARLVGQSIWNFIALKYGKDNISNILNLTRIIHNEQSSITSTLGVSFPKFMKDWTDFYLAGAPLHEAPEETVPVVILPPAKRIADLAPGEVDTDDYLFDEANVLRYQGAASGATQAGTTPDSRGGTKPGNGDVKLSAVKLFKNFLVSNDRKIDVVADPVRQFGLGYAISFHDLLQNNVFSFNSFIRPSTPLFKSFDFGLTYGHYARKVDFVFKYEKRSVDLETADSRDAFLFRPLNHVIARDQPEYLYRRLIQQRISATLIYPFSTRLKIEITPALVKNEDIDYEMMTVKGIPDDYYFAPNVSVVFDNTRVSSLGVETGTKAKVSFDQYYHTSNTLRSFKNTYVDIRHYQRIFRGLQVAGRLSYGTSRGNSPKYSFIGGVENSINRKTYQTDEVIAGGDPDNKNILLYNFPGTLRGFDFGRLYGNNHLLGNVELRSHLVEILPQMALSSNFLRNMQLVGFYDIGTAWMGSKGPFSRQNSLNTVITGQNSPFLIEVTNFKNPFLSGFGGGIRTTILGIFVRADYAYGFEDGTVTSPKFHLSVGKDF